MRVVIEWGQFAVMLGLLTRFVVLPLIRRVGVSFDGLFLLAAMALSLLDALDNYSGCSFRIKPEFTIHT